LTTENETKSSDEYPVRGGTFTGTVISTKMEKSATVRWEYTQEIPKYERKERRNTKVTVHVPEGIEVHEGDTVRVGETRPISKTKSHVIMEKVEDEQVEEE
jgi:small subunit ribosomal protein S17